MLSSRTGGVCMSNRYPWLTIDPAGPFNLGPRTFPGRVWTASGCFGYGLLGDDISAPGRADPFAGIGTVVTKTITAAPRTGNPPPRVWATEFGALNSIGLENMGVERFCDEVVPRLVERGIPFVASIAGTRPEEFGTLTRRLVVAAAAAPCWHGVELNLSCPNVARGGVDFGRDPLTVRACVEAARGETEDRVVLAKLTPNVASIAELARAAGEGGAHGLTAVNTLVGMDIDLRTGRTVLPRRRGGYSGGAILPVALAKVDEIVQETGLPVVGVGGVRTADDAAKFFAVGASAVQVGTAQMDDPFAAADVARALAAQ